MPRFGSGPNPAKAHFYGGEAPSPPEVPLSFSSGFAGGFARQFPNQATPSFRRSAATATKPIARIAIVAVESGTADGWE